jgi:hypothetical protein
VPHCKQSKTAKYCNTFRAHYIPGLFLIMDSDDSDYKEHVIEVAVIIGVIVLLAIKDCVLLYASHFDKVSQHTHQSSLVKT